MADIKISALPDSSPLDGSELVPIVQAGSTFKTTIQDIAALSTPTLAAISAAVAAPANCFIFTDAGSQLAGYGNWHIDPTTFFSNVDNFLRPDNLTGTAFAYSWNINVAPLQNSPDDSLRLQSFTVGLDTSATGFQFGSNGQAAELIGGGYNYGGNGATIGILRNINFFTSIGNGTDPGTFKGFVASTQNYNISAGITLDGGMTGYDFNVNINAAATTTSNFNVLWLSDFSQLPVDVYGYQGLVCQPNIATIKSGHNLNAISIGPNVNLMESNAGYYGITLGGTVTTLGTSGYSGAIINTNIGTMPATANVTGVGIFNQITTMAAGSSFHGVSISPIITTMHGNIDGCYQAFPQVTGGDGNVTIFTGGMGAVTTTGDTSVLSLNGQTLNGKQSNFSADGVRVNFSGILNAASGLGVLGQNVFFTEYHTPDDTVVTGTDIIVNILSPGVDFGNAGSYVSMGPSGLGVNMVGFAGQCGGHGGMDQLSALAAGAIFADDFTLVEWRNVNALLINAGYTGTCTNATAFYHELGGAGAFATNHWGVKIASDIDNSMYKLALNTPNQKVSSSNIRLQVGDGHIKSSQTAAPTVVPSSAAGTGATASVSQATDTAGIITLTVGSGAFSGGAQLTFSFNEPYAVAPIITLTPANDAAAEAVVNQMVSLINVNTTDFAIRFINPATTPGEVYTWTYMVLEAEA